MDKLDDATRIAFQQRLETTREAEIEALRNKLAMLEQELHSRDKKYQTRKFKQVLKAVLEECEFPRKQTKLLITLSDRKPHKKDLLASEVISDDIRKLISETNK